MTDTHTDDFMARVAAACKPSTNIDGWTGARQKRFLEAIADGETVRDACAHVFLSPQSAYAFRRRPTGQAFDMGWKAADLLARERVAADLLARATAGQVTETTRADGSVVVRHHYDNRLAVQMLNRLDRYADASERTEPGQTARTVAHDFDAYLALVGAEADPERTQAFARGCRDEDPLDPAQRADWTADQWRRAEAAGLIAPVEPASTRQPVSTSSPAHPLPADPLDEHVWYDDDRHLWLTDFPPPEDFDGVEDGDALDHDYARELTEGECAQLGLQPYDPDAELADREAERDRWFAANASGPGGDALSLPPT